MPYIYADQAHDNMVNDSNHDGALLKSAENLLVLQVSATPYNLLTKQSRIPMTCVVSRV